jgi:molybdate transport system substrate-binding protein
MKMRLFRCLAFSWLCVPLASGFGSASGDEIKVLCSNGIKPVLEELVPAFERDGNSKVSITYGVSASLARQIEGGEPFDVAILTESLIDQAVERSRIRRDSRALLARSAMALGVRRGSQQPPASTTDGLKQTLRSAASIAYAREGASAPFFARTLEVLGLTSEMTPKVRLTENGVQAGMMVAKGEADLCVLPTSEILPIAGVDVLSVFPGKLKGFLVMVGGIGAHARQPAAAASFIRFIQSPAAAPVLARRGMERP